jgi:chromosome segregation ATPase
MTESATHFMTTCPLCTSKLQVKRIYLGQVISCKQCGHSFLATDASERDELSPGEHVAIPLFQTSGNSERIAVVCENCKVSLSVKRSRVGQVIRCKQCDHEILVQPPRETAAAAPPPASARGAISAESLLRLAGSEGPELEDDAQRAARDHLQAELEQLRVAHALLRGELEEMERACQGTLAENESLHEQLGRLPSLEQQAKELDAARTERDSAATQLKQREAELDAARTERDSTAAQLKQREAELDAARTERDSTAAQLKQREAELDAARPERDSTAAQLKQWEAELDAARTERDSTAAQLKQWEADRDAARSERDSCAARLKEREAEFETARAHHSRADSQRQAALEQLEQHRSALAARDQATSQAEDRFRTEIGDLRRALEHQEHSHRDELARRTAELEDLNEQVRRVRDQLEASELACQNHQGRRQELALQKSQLESDLQSRLESERCRRSELEGEVAALRAEIATREASALRVAAPGPPGPDPTALGNSREAELESARAEIQKLRNQLREMERIQREIDAVLDGLGLRFELGQ